MSASTRRMATWPVTLLLALPGSCRDDPPGGIGEAERGADGRQAAPPATDRPRTPMETAASMRRWYRQRRYRLLEQYINPAGAAAVINTLMAMDKLLTADNELGAAVECRLGPGEAARWSVAWLADGIDIFSGSVRLICEDVKHDEAAVTFQVGDRIPLERAVFKNRDGRWVLQVDEPIPGLPGALDDFADAVGRVARRVREQPMTAEQIDSEWSVRLRPLEKRLRGILEAYARSRTAGAGGP